MLRIGQRTAGESDPRVIEREEEWDWPPRRRPRQAPHIEARVERERVVFTRQKPASRARRVEAVVADRFLKSVLLLYRIVFGAILGLVIVASVWFVVAILRA